MTSDQSFGPRRYPAKDARKWRLRDEVGAKVVGRCIIGVQANSQADPDPARGRASCRFLPYRVRLSLPENLHGQKDSVLRITSRLIVSLIVGIGLVASLFTYFQVRGEKREMRAELTS